jgi:hypothetical protein
MSTFEACLVQWQSTSLVEIRVTRGHEFNSRRRHRYVITHKEILTKNRLWFWLLTPPDFNILLFLSQDGRAIHGAAFRSQSSLLGEGSNPSSDTRLLLLFRLYFLHSSTVKNFWWHSKRQLSRCGRVVKATDSKSVSLWERRFESYHLRSVCFSFYIIITNSGLGLYLADDCKGDDDTQQLTLYSMLLRRDRQRV